MAVQADDLPVISRHERQVTQSPAIEPQIPRTTAESMLLPLANSVF